MRVVMTGVRTRRAGCVLETLQVSDVDKGENVTEFEEELEGE